MNPSKLLLLAAFSLGTPSLLADPFNDRDRNQDGKLSPGELPEGLQKNFDRIDTNHDGFISREEDQAARQRASGGANAKVTQQAVPDTIRTIYNRTRDVFQHCLGRHSSGGVSLPS